MKQYYLDPDYRKRPNTDKPFCIRCQKEIKDTKKAVRVSLVNDYYVIEGGKLLVGLDCWNKIRKD